jgi:drug/metabolite transporter (DMT)-like permease
MIFDLGRTPAMTVWSQRPLPGRRRMRRRRAGHPQVGRRTPARELLCTHGGSARGDPPDIAAIDLVTKRPLALVLTARDLRANWQSAGVAFPHHHVRGGVVVIVLLSLASAVAYGVAAVLQHHATTKEAPEQSIRLGLVARLARQPLWLLGNALDGVGFLFQFLALRRGSLPLVEPLLVLSLVVALPVAARLEHRRISAAALGAAGAVAVGLALFLAVGQPGIGHPRASLEAWIALSGIVAVFCGATVWAGNRTTSRQRAAVFLAAGSGVAFGYVAALTERTGHLLDRGALHTLTSWEPYALLVAGAVALLLTQGAFHAGALRLSLPTLTVAQPLVAIAISLSFFGEHLDTRGAAPVFELIGLAMVTAGVFAIAQTPLIAGLEEQPAG